MDKTKEQLFKEFIRLGSGDKDNSCDFCNSCNSCNSCDFCYSCDFCNFCNSCNSCLRLVNGILCKKLRFKAGDKNANNKDKYWVLNQEVSKKEFEKVKEIIK